MKLTADRKAALRARARLGGATLLAAALAAAGISHLVASPADAAVRAATAPTQAAAPHLQRTGNATQLIVDGKPFLVLAGELHNSDSSTVTYLNNTVWPALGNQPGLNTVIVPVSWAQWEPAPGTFAPALVDDAIAQARKYNKKIVFAWFGSWKNSDSSYAPSWVKRDQADYPLAQIALPDGGTGSADVLSPFGAKTEAADASAYAALMREISKDDPTRSTVIMMQVENEVGLLSASSSATATVSSRDLSPAATAAWNGPVPAALTSYLAAHKAELEDEVATAWTSHGSRMSGTWAQVFGDTPQGQEIFMAWAYSTYVNAVAAAGKAQYNIPMYANTWIVQPTTSAPGGSTPGQYPSGGAVVGVRDVWRAGAPSIDLLAPDIYLPGFADIYDQYGVDKDQTQYANFVSESIGGAAGAANSFYAIGQGAIGYSPFAIESSYPTDQTMQTAYSTLHELSAQIAAAQQAGTLRSVWINPSAGTANTASVTLGGYTIKFTLSSASTAEGYALVLPNGEDGFTLAGNGVVATFSTATASGKTVALDTDEEGSYTGGTDVNGGYLTGATWTVNRVLNGDETSAGYFFGDQAQQHQAPTEVKLAAGQVQQVTLYTY